MSKVKVFIIEDDFIHANRLEMYLDEMGYELAGTAVGASQALNLIAATKPDLLLVDIHLAGDRDGIQIVENINKKKAIPVIFITSYRDKETFERAKLTDPYVYILKPYDKETLQAAIELTVYKISKINDTQIQNNYHGWNNDRLVKDELFIKSNGILIKIKLSDILYVEAKDKMCIIGMAEELIETRMSLQKLEEKLPIDRFLRIHRSFIINTKEISQINLSKNEVQLGPYKVPIGRSYKEPFINSIDSNID
ncbi:LytTR family transcriptional regulator DNA-binding domain-containing protein [Marivirga sp. S37H4]|uniref:LytTR family transcriptional regulator DNA-binding domain-containing protein n=1 Tax=Marivirga aurantiaca TaxID=2802615 RepID=A0A934WWS8_9BACT|nr:LytTR family transcriptional regulator DNA-binding domain-containing protein [Marivirga aurantiaca]MBK6264366.1 LytTR family transcriptional regulator DNA-binding domain-containing protein [Marivirga aurantiaca]